MRAWISAVLLGLLAGFTAVPAAAQENARRVELAGEIVVLLDVENTVGEMFQAMTPILASGLRQELRLSRADEERLTELLRDELRSAMPELMAAVVNSYSERLNEQELADIVAFLRSPSGRAMLQNQKDAEEEMQQLGRTIGLRVALQALTRLNAERAAR